jgi:hypothetical protein
MLHQKECDSLMPDDQSSPKWIIHCGIHAAIKRRSLTPLVRALELALAASSSSPVPESKTIFSCDSFCEPHLQAQLRFYKILSKISKENINFLNMPIGHYITSIPDISLLRLANHPTRIIVANDQLIGSQACLLSCIPEGQRLPSGPQDLHSLSQEYELLIKVLDDHSWKSIYIGTFPFHELSHRDLSLTYKSQPLLTTDSHKSFYEHYILSNKFNLWLLCVLACEPLLGKHCYCMSFYTSNAVFMYFCGQTGRSIQSFGPPVLSLKEFGLDVNEYMCITDSPNAGAALTNPSVTKVLSDIQISSAAKRSLLSIINKRFDGLGSHTYSRGQAEESNSAADWRNWIQEQKHLGKKIVSLFTSSPDELIGQQFGYKHHATDLSHLPLSIFHDQTHWLETVIRHFADIQEDTSLIIRLHPRLGADKRGLPESPGLKDILEHLNQLIGSSQAIRLVHPSDPMSSYWLGLHSDLILNGWSTIGLEFAIKGKVVTNAFYKCPLGGAAVYPVHTQTPPLLSTTDYLRRVSRLLKAIRRDSPINGEDVISSEQAIKAFIAGFSFGLVKLEDGIQLRCQLASPSILTSQMLSLMMD